MRVVQPVRRSAKRAAIAGAERFARSRLPGRDWD